MVGTVVVALVAAGGTSGRLGNQIAAAVATRSGLDVHSVVCHRLRDRSHLHPHPSLLDSALRY